MTVYNVPQGYSVIDLLARQLLAETANDPLALGDIQIYLPNRRAVRSLQDAFLRESDGRALILPALQSLGDADDSSADGLTAEELPGDLTDAELTQPKQTTKTERAFALSQLILAAGDKLAARPGPANSVPLEISPDQSFRMAMTLGALLDQAENEGIALEQLAQVQIKSELANHWELSLEFLEILFGAWPSIEADLGQSNRIKLQRLARESVAHRWRMNPPPGRIIAAGSTGSIPSTRHLLATIASLPHGQLILPGLDRVMAADDWQVVRNEPSHPQFNLAHLVAACELSPDQVQLWPGVDPVPSVKERLTSLALLPARQTDKWQSPNLTTGRLTAAYRLDCNGPDAEATAIAVIMREGLEQPDRRTTLITPDRTLARRVIQELRRWDIDVDDSAGRPFKNSTHGLFARQTLAAMVSGFAPVSLMALLKNPLALVDEEDNRARFKGRLNVFEGAALRGEAPLRGIANLPAHLARIANRDHRDKRFPLDEQVAAFVDNLVARIAPSDLALDPATELSFTAWLSAHLAIINALSSTDEFWRGADADTLADLFNEMADAATSFTSSFQAITAEHYRDMFDALLSPMVSRRARPSHPRLSIQGTIEGRLEQPERLILAGLNEGVWPSEPVAGPWLSNDMRNQLGLPTPERKLGLQAHDFTQALGAEEVWITRTAKEGGSPTRPSRWLQRLGAVMHGANIAFDQPPFDPLTIADGLDTAHAQPSEKFLAPEGLAPLALRPAGLSITEIETWYKDPYAIYAKHVLGLRALDPLDQVPSIRDRGTIVHNALEEFFRTYPGEIPKDAVRIMESLARPKFDELEQRSPAARAFWWPRFQRVASWIAEHERNREGLRRFVEQRGKTLIDGFQLRGVADRLDVTPAGAVEVLDYKVGTPPNIKDVVECKAPQLALEAIMIEQGAFVDVPSTTVAQLSYWKVGGSGKDAVKPINLNAEKTGVAVEANREKLRETIAAYQMPDKTYPAVPDAKLAPSYSDYKLLARWDAWLNSDDDSEEGDA